MKYFAAFIAALARMDGSSAITLPDLPYAYDALEPILSERTLTFHHDAHHNAYVESTNSLIEGTDLENDSAEEILMATYDSSAGTHEQSALFNAAAQSWNHAFYWKCMTPNGGGHPSGDLFEQIVKDFGSYDEFSELFLATGNTVFGSGWAWLSTDKSGSLYIQAENGAVTPLVEGLTPILTMDVWEHAYYLDYQNLRAVYTANFLDELVDWDFVQANYGGAKM